MKTKAEKNVPRWYIPVPPVPVQTLQQERDTTDDIEAFLAGLTPENRAA